MKWVKRMTFKAGCTLIFAGVLLTGCSAMDTEKSEEPNKGAKEVTEQQSKHSDEHGSEDMMEEPSSASDQQAREVTEAMPSPLLKKGEETLFSFPNEGVYLIHCDPHPVMKMKVIVQTDAKQTDSVSLNIKDYEFSEKEITVAPGTLITWRNQDSAQHNVAIEIE
ncbi:hypothetical protein ABE65_012270 [Fictibacillus phosphorivorans]|uniref:Blue (type 1) copper domain-containing protein n=1 Tax=Fictibacillus phosphorivorans TaxID=1221500 RepID=A0A160IMR3_9BACL|nr:plastocyanin/azurin family copper-binding protein [Fictibacillus phosphorivorans]ANC77531.1 hypothetical protein ABE65_012270 [Fictibacillus phosphorivorans]